MLRTVFSFGVLGVGLLIADSQGYFGRYIQIYDPDIFLPASTVQRLKARAAVPELKEAARPARETETDAERSAELTVVLYKPWRPIPTEALSDAMSRGTGLKPADEEAHRDLT